MTDEVRKKKFVRGGNGIDISDPGNSYRQNWAVDRVGISSDEQRGRLG